jgi:hypothetical protein
MTRLWHYTSEDRLEAILESEQINTTLNNITHKKEKPTCWVSSNPLWENTATKMLTDGNGNYKKLKRKEQEELFGLARIEVEPKFGFYAWKTFRKLAKVDKKIADNMELSGKENGAKISEWFCSFKPIPIDYWIRAEVYKNGQWIEYAVFEEIE